MTVETNSSLAQLGTNLPWDLSQWVDRRILLEWTKAEVESLGWDKPELEAYLKRHPSYRPKLLLCVLTWSYATGVFESAEISHACDQDPLLRALCGERPVPEKELGRFRRENRGLLKWALMRLMRRSVALRFNLEANWFPPGLRRYLSSAAVLRLDLARQYDRGSSGF